MTLRLVISPRRTARGLAAAALFLGLMSLAAHVTEAVPTDRPLLQEARESFVRLFDADREANVPTWYSTLLLLWCALWSGAVAAAARRGRDPFALHWALMAAGFLYLSVDEAAVIHEMAIKPVRAVLGDGPWLRHAWVVPAVLALGAAGAVSARFIAGLPSRTRRLLAFAAAVYAGAGIGIETVSGYWVALHGEGNLVHGLITTVEEVTEMLGAILLAHALHDHALRRIGKIDLFLGEEVPPEPPAAGSLAVEGANGAHAVVLSPKRSLNAH